MSADTYERIQSALDGPSDHSFVRWLLDEAEDVCVALESVLLSLSGNYGVPLPGLKEQECVLAIYEKLVVGLADSASQELARGLQDRYILLKWQWTSLSHCILQSLLTDSSKPANADSGCGVLLRILDDMHTVDTKLVPFYNAPLLLDIEFRFGLRQMLADASLVSDVLDQAQLDYITMSVDQLVDMADPPYQNGLVDLEMRADQARESLCAATAAGTGDGNVSTVAAATSLDSAFEGGSYIAAETVLQVKELIPDLGDGFIRACLDYYGRSVEAVVVAIFEGNLPPSLVEMDRAAEHWVRPMATAENMSSIGTGTLVNSAEEAKQEDVLGSRRNIFDKDEFDIFHHNSLDWSRVQQGKSKTHPNLEAPNTEFKSRIMEIAQRIEDEDEYDDTYDHTAQDITASAIDAKEDMYASSNGQVLPEHKPQAKAVADPIKPWEDTLVRLYTEDPTLFERKRETRNSPARIALCTQTGLTHEQIEGWFIMFRRNPRHQLIINRHSVNTNRPNARKSRTPASDASVQDSVEEDGRRDAPEAPAQPAKHQDFRNKGKYKAKIGNHDRKRQQARKARNIIGGLPPPLS
ncbi:hypothetical protein FBU31_000179 [Coemansia sp. 'formosensis']|nr:hypothetical protein FBU31_000179 [Coemansia sp. 'formosensis']